MIDLVGKLCKASNRIIWNKTRFVLVCGILLFSSKLSFSQGYSFNHHESLTSGRTNDNDTIFTPNHLFAEQNLDSLDLYVQISPHNMIEGDIVGVSFYVNGENHADAFVFKKGLSLWIQIQYTINGEIIPRCNVFMGAFSKKASIHIKRVDNDIVFYYPYEREINRIGLGYLFHGACSTDDVAPIMFYAFHADNHKPFTVDFDY